MGERAHGKRISAVAGMAVGFLVPGFWFLVPGLVRTLHFGFELRLRHSPSPFVVSRFVFHVHGSGFAWGGRIFFFFFFFFFFLKKKKDIFDLRFLIFDLSWETLIRPRWSGIQF